MHRHAHSKDLDDPTLIWPSLCAAVASDDDCRLVLAVDEAQLLYNTEGSGSNQFFTALKRLDPSKCNVRLLIAAAYGAGASSDSQTGRPESPVATPGDIDTSESITIHPGRVSLQLDPEDVDELWCAWTAAANLQLEDMVRDRIAAMCASQVIMNVRLFVADVCCSGFMGWTCSGPCWLGISS